MSTNKYEYTGVKLPRDIKKRVRALAAENETSIGEMALRLILSGLDEYQSAPSIPDAARLAEART